MIGAPERECRRCGEPSWTGVPHAGKFDSEEVPLKTVTVASAGRKLGKTAVACAMIRELAAAGCRVSAVKARPLEGVDLRVLPGPGREGSDTHRFSLAGAAFQALVDFGSERALKTFVGSRDPVTDVLVVEGGTAAELLDADLSVYVTGSNGDPLHPGLLDTADAVFRGLPGQEVLDRAAGLARDLVTSSDGPGGEDG